MNKILKFVFFARKHPELKLYEKIQPTAENKTILSYIRFLCTKPEMSKRATKTSFKYAKRFNCLTISNDLKNEIYQLYLTAKLEIKIKEL